ncbi:hypothetical protein SAMN02745134_00061 [Clostridium acidisoli DSM 12555]|uniref:DUF2087 domain-containing protein n=1 Tax=Clostridium acidisoli DSM 12555 TaxID=1121291 RepID=A0A1W1WXB5_9CLOT|nr:DUF2087 domain-containing protein [Clostridium acidisoli]SMC16369.1 hypothetical protein SAMN02745134_00061 [Clostridium acidisoli DSM 12555]
MDLKMELKNYLDNMGRLKIYPSKKKYKLLALMFLATKFEKGVIYTEKEVNEIIDNVHTFNDRCLIRRELFNNRFLGRTNDCSKYWLEETQPILRDFKIG